MSATSPQEQFGRFRVRRLLGEGAQGQVFLADDPHLGRPVAIKTLVVADGQLATARRLVEEARTVSRLSHRNIVTLYDAGEQAGLPYLVLEYVPGVTLEALLQREGRLPIPRAVEIALHMLEGVGCAHDGGILHRDIKPANVMIDESGTARLMDFGVAAHLTGNSQNGPVMGSPRYTAPECLERGSFSKASDVYAVAATLYEAVTGKPAVDAADLPGLLARIRRGDIVPPARHNPEIDERLEGIICRGLSLRSEDRYAGPGEMAAALQEYSQRPSVTVAGGDHDTIAFLLRRMQHKKDFPALSESMRAINRIVASNQESANTLSAVILKDFALTNKLLKVVNSAVYGHAGKVSTVSRAVVILGFETVRSIAVTLLFLGHLQNKAQVQNLQEEVIGTLLTGLMARDITGDLDPRVRESAFLYGIYQSLGRLLAYYYFYDEAVEINRRMQQEGIDEPAAAQAVLGVSYERLGTEIARTWNFPSEMLQAMRKLPAGDLPAHPRGEREKLWVTANLAEDLRQVILRTAPEGHEQALATLARRYQSALPVNGERLRMVTASAHQAVSGEASAININVSQSRVLQQLKKIDQVAAAESPTPAGEVPLAVDLARTMAIEGESARGAGNDAAAQAAPPVEPQAVLTSGIQDITATLVGEFRLNDLLHMVIETMYRGMGFTRVLLAILNGKTQKVEGRFGLGADVEGSLKRFSVPMGDARDLFAAALRHGKDVLITDAGADSVKGRLPAWFATAFRPAGFVLFPLVVDKRPFGLFYADQEEAGRLRLGKAEADLLLTLRNQAVLAIRQGAGRR